MKELKSSYVMVTTLNLRTSHVLPQVDTTLEMSDNDFALICAGHLKPEYAFMVRRLTVKGNLLRAMRLNALFELMRKNVTPRTLPSRGSPAARL